MGGITTVLLDVGGILLLPSADVMRAAIGHSGIEPTDEQLRRAHYAATAATDAKTGTDEDVYRRAFAASCGVPAEFEAAVCELFTQSFTGHTWQRVAPGAKAGIERLLAEGFRVGIVSNSVGTVARMLATAGVCQVGAGPYAPVEVIIDSAIVGARKPDPRIFGFALTEMGVDASETAYLGDTARADVDGARLAGLRPIHFDPYGDCPDLAGDHEHLDRFDRLADLLRS
ncbi:HAD family hydrolase [Kibdelosporangium persicum]|uniref:HAD-superfamily hydrolase, subfamily IA, variant 3 n=1 Tax=Kibdelosporangium persicum TaxID=2698649 RepID=A0ABX2EWS6_9PSEU|nr:HAD family hydrolase [Kibdelosporangium persicum]NRN63469.1 HAD-superfamily hydrolase, subfamily IA, variant 3 [Kibdelosporangium persicum]